MVQPLTHILITMVTFYVGNKVYMLSFMVWNLWYYGKPYALKFQ